LNLNKDSKTQYSIPYLLSLKKKYSDRPENLKEIKIPLKHEIRSRAKTLTDEAFRETRNYLNLDSEILGNSKIKSFVVTKENNVYEENSINNKEFYYLNKKSKEIREILNKISFDNYDFYRNEILKINYDQYLMEIFKVVLTN